MRFAKIVAIVFAIYIFYSLFFISPKDREERYIEANYKLHFHGVVIDKFIDKANRSNNSIILDNGKKVTSDLELYNVARLNDSISKSKGTLEILVFRKPNPGSAYVLLKEVYRNNVVRKRAQFIHSDTIQDLPR